MIGAALSCLITSTPVLCRFAWTLTYINTSIHPVCLAGDCRSTVLLGVRNDWRRTELCPCHFMVSPNIDPSIIIIIIIDFALTSTLPSSSTSHLHRPFFPTTPPPPSGYTHRNQYDKNLILDGLHYMDGDHVTTPTDLYQIIIDALASSSSLTNDDEVYPQLKMHLDELAKATSFAEVVHKCYEITTFLSRSHPVVVLNPSLDLASIHVNHSNARLERSRSHCEVVKYNEVRLPPLYWAWAFSHCLTDCWVSCALLFLCLCIFYSISVCMMKNEHQNPSISPWRG